MGSLIPDVTCADPEPPASCRYPFEVGEQVMLVAVDALEQFVIDGACEEPIQAYVSLGEPRSMLDDFACGALIDVWRVSHGFTPDTNSAMSRTRHVAPAWRDVWRVELREGCYPMVEGTAQPRPMPLDQLHEVHRHIYAHGDAIFAAVTGAYMAGTLIDGTCPLITFSDLVPIGPSGPLAGFRFDVSVDY